MIGKILIKVHSQVVSRVVMLNTMYVVQRR